MVSKIKGYLAKLKKKLSKHLKYLKELIKSLKVGLKKFSGSDNILHFHFDKKKSLSTFKFILKHELRVKLILDSLLMKNSHKTL